MCTRSALTIAFPRRKFVTSAGASTPLPETPTEDGRSAGSPSSIDAFQLGQLSPSSPRGIVHSPFPSIDEQTEIATDELAPTPLHNLHNRLNDIDAGAVGLDATAANNDGYEIALDALMSLGSSENASPGNKYVFSPPNLGSVLDLTNPNQPPGVIHVSSERAKGACLLSEERTLQLMKYYRYEVAPWVRFPASHVLENHREKCANKRQIHIGAIARHFGSRTTIWHDFASPVCLP
jgi:hypothetical protein